MKNKKVKNLDVSRSEDSISKSGLRIAVAQTPKNNLTTVNYFGERTLQSFGKRYHKSLAAIKGIK